MNTYSTVCPAEDDCMWRGLHYEVVSFFNWIYAGRWKRECFPCGLNCFHADHKHPRVKQSLHCTVQCNRSNTVCWTCFKLNFERLTIWIWMEIRGCLEKAHYSQLRLSLFWLCFRCWAGSKQWAYLSFFFCDWNSCLLGQKCHYESAESEPKQESGRP